MASSATTLSVFILCLISCPIVRTLNIEVVESSKCLKVPAVEFVGSVKATIETILQVTSFVSKYTSKVMGSSRLSHAITDCLDLLDLSVEELGWTISASQKTHGKGNGTGNLSNDLRTWLGGALINQDTCIEGFDGTHSIIKSAVSRTLTKVTSLVRSILLMVDPTPKTKHRTTSHSKATHGGGKIHDPKADTEVHHPYWFTREDRKLIQTINGVTANVTVAADGTGNFTTVNEALNLAPNSSNARFVIYIKKGVYNEYIEISKKKWNIMMIGDGMDVTILSGNRSFIDGWTTYRSSTFAVKGRGFIARDITFENTAGPQKHQAVAFRSDSDLSVLYRCAFRGYQDTLYAHSMRQFYRECTITGTVDFIFGDGSVVFQNCNILARKGLPNQKNTITAQGRKEPNEPSGFSIQFSNFSGDSELLASLNSTQTYLGRPWKLYSRTVIMQCYMSEAIMPQGWLEWNTTFALDSLYYAEYMNYGPGAGLGKRVKWPGFHVLNDTAQADYFTVAQFILGNSWLPSTGVKYTAGLLP